MKRTWQKKAEKCSPERRDEPPGERRGRGEVEVKHVGEVDDGVHSLNNVRGGVQYLVLNPENDSKKLEIIRVYTFFFPSASTIFFRRQRGVDPSLSSPPSR